MDKEEIIIYIHNRLAELKNKKTIWRDVRTKNQGRIEELEEILNRIQLEDLNRDESNGENEMR